MLQLLFLDSVTTYFFQLPLLDLSESLLPGYLLQLLLVCQLFTLLSELILRLELALPLVVAGIGFI